MTSLATPKSCSLQRQTEEGRGSISPNFFCQAKSFRRMPFGKKFAVQFHQQSRSEYAKICTPFAKRCSPKKVSNLVCAKLNFLRTNGDEIDPGSQSYKKWFIRRTKLSLIFLICAKSINYILYCYYLTWRKVNHLFNKKILLKFLENCYILPWVNFTNSILSTYYDE